MTQATGNKKKGFSNDAKKALSAKSSGTQSKSKQTTTKTGSPDSSQVKESIIKALSHSEAEDGLYFRNFFLLHEEDQRPSVKASPKDILEAMNQLLLEGRVRIDYDDLDVTFRLV